MGETTTSCPACGSEKFTADRTYRDHASGRILRNRHCLECKAEWQTEEKYVRMLK